MEGAQPGAGGPTDWRWEGWNLFRIHRPLLPLVQLQEIFPVLRSPRGGERSNKLLGWKREWRKLTGMGGPTVGGLTRNLASCLEPRHPSPSSPPPPQKPKVPALLPNPSHPYPKVSLRWRMEAERPTEEDDGEQGPQPDGLDEQGWPPVNSPTTRPWRSAPPSPPPGARHTVLGPLSASLLSLQTELLLDLVAEAQSRRLEEQRATFHTLQVPKNLAPALPRPLEEKEQLYTTILSHQCQRMEAQRSEPPLPPGGQELLELLLRVQGGGRMEEQRSRPPTHTC